MRLARLSAASSFLIASFLIARMGPSFAADTGPKLTAAPMPAVMASAAPLATGTSTPRELQGSRARTRFVLALERHAEFQVFSLQNPNRVIVDLPDVKVQLPQMTAETPIGLVKSFRGGLAAAGKMRVVIDMTEPVVVDKAVLEPAKDGRGPRLVLEIVPVEGAKQAAKKPFVNAQLSGVGLASVQPPHPRPAERPEAREARSYKPIIVLDPGHGGQDSGATRNGAVEKDVVLAFAQVLRAKLNATGRYKVLMTRDTDQFIPLHERREFAERNKAALFIAIHADYASSTARGATIYSLREGVANELKRSAKGEVGDGVLSDKESKALRQSDSSDIGAIRGILAELAQREVQVTKERTSVFARSMIEYMGSSTNMMSNPDRSAAFAVLRTAKVPAILMELAYVSNKEDAAKLKSDEWRAKVSGSIVTAIDNYFSHQLARLPM